MGIYLNAEAKEMPQKTAAVETKYGEIKFDHSGYSTFLGTGVEWRTHSLATQLLKRNDA
jgi:hypothetical protein